MPIEISCNNCSKRLRVPDTAAGKRVKCPGCQTVLSVPAGGSASGTGSAVGASGPGAVKYHLKTEDGQTFGPVPKSELDEWLAEGRVTAECQILKDGGDQWQWASDIYPQLEQSSEPAAASGSSAGGFPGIDTGDSGGASDNPFAFAADDTSPTSRVSGGRRKAGGAPRVSTSSSSSYSSGGAASGGESDKSKMVAGLLSLFLGNMGVGRFYLGYTGMGVAMLLTCGGCGWWSLIDAIMIFTDKVPDAQGRKLRD